MSGNLPIFYKSDKAIGSLLGAAYGDALGWPNELRCKSKVSNHQSHLGNFIKWSRYSGGRFSPYSETIEPGEYSDDTQLILCLCRSLLKGERWWDFYTHVELPFWSLYERGGGGATKRAVASWLDGTSPWHMSRKSEDVKKYFDAGGNGVAMRVLPHILYLNSNAFSVIANSIFLDAITTHGHPKAILGAIVYGFALWSSFHNESKLGYGELIENLLSNVSVWSILPSPTQLDPFWLSQANKYLGDYSKLWLLVKDEILEGLAICRTEISKGALSFINSTLENLQCFDKRVNGSGTISAVAAIYLSSRHAADPINGVVAAAFAIGADTDTIASMTGGLLGCINGSSWLSTIKTGIQDFSYLEKIALLLVENKLDAPSSFVSLNRSSLNKWEEKLFSFSSNVSNLPDGRPLSKVICGLPQIGRSGKYKVEFMRFSIIDGQTIYINKISKINSSSLSTPSNSQISKLQSVKTNFGPKLPVSSIEKSVLFYNGLLGLSIRKQTSDFVSFDQGLVLTSNSYPQKFGIVEFRSLLYTEVTDIQTKYNKVIEFGTKLVTPLDYWNQSKLRFFRCLDPDNNLVEIFEVL